MSSWKFLCLVLAALASSSEAVVRLRHLDTIYLPVAYQPETRYAFADDAAEQMTFDKNSHISYVVGKNNIHIIDHSKPGQLQNIGYLTNSQAGEFTDIEACGNWLAASFDNSANPLEGKVFVYSTTTRPLTQLHDIIVGAVPDMLKWTRDCRTLVVAIEGQLSEFPAGQFVDPEGAVGIIKFPESPEDATYDIRTADFTKFNNLENLYISKGVRRVYRGEGLGVPVTFSQDLEPEYIDFNDDETIAFVVLQEANAIATVDIQNAVVREIYPLGEVKYSRTGLDPSDKDGGINLRAFEVYGTRQPDAIKYLRIGGVPYIFSANEGDAKKYKFDGLKYDESQRGDKFGKETASTVNSALKKSMENDQELGRLQFSTVDGKLANGDFDRFVSYGSRGFSVFNAESFSLVWDSGNQLEREVSRYYPDVFNSEPGDMDEAPFATKDRRSDNKGPEPESLETGELKNGKKVLFVGLERPGFIAIYTIDEKRPGGLNLEFQSMHYAGGQGQDATWRQLWESRSSRDLDPEDMKFLSAKESPTGQPLLAVVGTASGTLSFYEVAEDGIFVEAVSDNAACIPPPGGVLLCVGEGENQMDGIVQWTKGLWK